MKFTGNLRIKLFIATLLIISILSSITFASCRFEDLGLEAISGKRDSKNTVNKDDEVPTVEEQVMTEEFFLQLKAKQLNKNPLSDINIRKAILYAVDRERIASELFGGYGEVANSLFPVGSIYWNPSWSCYRYDPGAAKEYLAKAGYGPDNPLYITIGAVDNSEAKELVEEIIREDFKKIGIDIWIFNKPPKEWYEDFVKNSDYEIGLWSLIGSDEDCLKNSFSSEKIPSMETEDNTNCENFYWYKNEKVDQIFFRLENMQDTEERKGLFKDLQDQLAGDAVVLPLYNRLFVIAYNGRYENIDFEVIDNHLRFDIEKWAVAGDSGIDGGEGDGSTVRVGYQAEEIDIFNSFEINCINDLVFDGLYESGNDGAYDALLVDGHIDNENQDQIMEMENFGPITGLEKAITLRDDVYWDDGTPVTTEDIRYTYDFYRKVLEEGDYFFEIDEDYLKIDSLEITGDKTFKIIFKDRFDDWQKFFSVIIKKDTFLDKNVNYFPPGDIYGCGPYGIKEYVKDSYLLLEKNEYYYGEKPQIENVKIFYDPDIHNLIAMLKEGEIDILSIPVDKALMEELESSGEFKLVIKQGNLLEHLALSLKPAD
ncbi:MAG: hypothetical protein JW770_02945 [Actinobacteria bacterium]|nr:hypothetical protein [Actinomycetota bacterium]